MSVPRIQWSAGSVYLYPAMKAVEVSAAGGEQLVVEVRKA